MTKSRGKQINRRTFVVATAAGAALATAPALARGRKKATGGAAMETLATSPNPLGADVRAFLGHIRAGTRLGKYSVVEVFGPTKGAIPVVLEADGIEPFQVDIVRREPGKDGVGNSRSLSVFVANGGNGRRWTGNRHGLGAMALAAALEAREQAGAVPPRLLTLGERTARFPGAELDVLRG